MQLIRGLLPVVDNLERALAQVGTQSDVKSVREGLELIARQIQTFLEAVGLAAFSAAGEKFDPHKHEAVAHVQSKEHPDHFVLEEIQKGYTLNGRVVRHALVKVVDNPQAPAEAASSQPAEETPTPEDIPTDTQEEKK